MSEPDVAAQAERPASAQISPPVFFGAAGIILIVVLIAVAMPETVAATVGDVQSYFVDTFGWFYLLSVAVFLVFSVGIAVSPYGRIKLGRDHSEPDFSYRSWFAMLFSAGMGIGLLFFGVAEPITHYVSPPVGPGRSVEAAEQAMAITFFHWGLHAWAIYAVVGLSLAYFGFRHNLPLTVRSAFFPIIGHRIYGPIGHVVDVFAVFGTMFGVATSLGIGVMQVNAGLNYLFDVPQSLTVQLTLIAVITLFATGSVVAGLDAGIRRLSELNLVLALTLMAFMLLVGPTVLLLQMFVENIGTYLSDVVDKTFDLYAYERSEWIGGWTLFYWGWWIAWSPFVGMFIARVSRGRTVREFILGVLLVPTAFTFLWMTLFGNTAIDIELASFGIIADAVQENLPVAIFKLFEQLPLATLASGVATILVVTFFVTSSDSGSLVIDIITSGGRGEPPTWQRVFWAVTEGVVAAVLLLAGGLTALQTASIASALPFAVIMLVMCWGLLKGLRMEGLRMMAHGIPPAPTLSGAQVPWQRRLGKIVTHPTREAVQQFIETTAREALEEIAAELQTREYRAEVTGRDDRVTLSVYHGDEPEFRYQVRLRGYQAPRFAFPEFDLRRSSRRDYYRAEVFLGPGAQNYDIMGYTKEEVIGDVLSQYDKHMTFLHLAR